MKASISLSRLGILKGLISIGYQTCLKCTWMAASVAGHQLIKTFRMQSHGSLPYLDNDGDSTFATSRVLWRPINWPKGHVFSYV